MHQDLNQRLPASPYECFMLSIKQPNESRALARQVRKKKKKKKKNIRHEPAVAADRATPSSAHRGMAIIELR